MHYVISDIHGCLQEFKALLQKAGFSENDLLYVIGDSIDRGPDSAGLLRLMSLYDNIIPIMGNHEYLFGKVASDLFTEITDQSIDHVLTKDFLGLCHAWQLNGGQTTMDEFRRLSQDDREFYIDYVADFSLYETLNLNGRDYILIHSLPDGFSGEGELSYSVEEILFGRPDFNGKWEQKTVFITGHTPTVKIDRKYAGRIYHKGNFYDIDCGCVTGNRLGMMCLETGQEFYTDSLDAYWTGKKKKDGKKSDEKPEKKLSGKSVKKPDKKLSGKSVKKPGKKSSGKSVKKPEEKPSGKSVKKLVGKLSEKSDEKISGKSVKKPDKKLVSKSSKKNKRD